MTEALNRWQFGDQLAEALEGEPPARVTRVANVLWRKGVRSMEDIGGYDVNDVIEWYGVGPKMVPMLQRLGMKGELSEQEDKEPVERRKLECSICGAAMEVGSRARISIQWEYERMETRWGDPLPKPMQDLAGRSTMVCRDCAAKMSRDAGIPIPTEAKYGDA